MKLATMMQFAGIESVCTMSITLFEMFPKTCTQLRQVANKVVTIKCNFSLLNIACAEMEYATKRVNAMKLCNAAQTKKCISGL